MEEEMVDKLVEMNAKYLRDNLQWLVDEHTEKAKEAAHRWFYADVAKFPMAKVQIAIAEQKVAERFMANMNSLLDHITRSGND